jgi:CrcB protein
MGRLFLISLGGAVGTAARYLLSVWLLRALGPAFPYGTLAVNVIGSFLLGVVMQAGGDASPLSPTARLVLGTGVMGGFTTYSAFNYETLQYLQQGAWATAGLYVAATLLGCLGAGAVGLAVARAL